MIKKARRVSYGFPRHLSPFAAAAAAGGGQRQPVEVLRWEEKFTVSLLVCPCLQVVGEAEMNSHGPSTTAATTATTTQVRTGSSFVTRYY